jgi:hypothetical protein
MVSQGFLANMMQTAAVATATPVTPAHLAHAEEQLATVPDDATPRPFRQAVATVVPIVRSTDNTRWREQRCRPMVPPLSHILALYIESISRARGQRSPSRQSQPPVA